MKALFTQIMQLILNSVKPADRLKNLQKTKIISLNSKQCSPKKQEYLFYRFWQLKVVVIALPISQIWETSKNTFIVSEESKKVAGDLEYDDNEILQQHRSD